MPVLLYIGTYSDHNKSPIHSSKVAHFWFSGKCCRMKPWPDELEAAAKLGWVVRTSMSLTMSTDHVIHAATAIRIFC